MEMSQNAISFAKDLLYLNDKKNSTELSSEERSQDPGSLASSSSFFSSQQSIESSLKSRSISDLVAEYSYHLRQASILRDEISKCNSESAKEAVKQFDETFTRRTISLG